MARPRQAKTALSLRLVLRGADYSAVSHGATRGRSSLLLCPDASGVLLISLPEAVSGPALAAFLLLDVLPIPADRVEVTTLLQGRSYSASENGVNFFCDRIRAHTRILCPLSSCRPRHCAVLAVLPIRPIFEILLLRIGRRVDALWKNTCLEAMSQPSFGRMPLF